MRPMLLALSWLIACGGGDKADDTGSTPPGTTSTGTPPGTVSDADADGDGVPAPTDCNDADPDVYPGAPEICDGLDQNCNAITDEGVTTLFWRDTDGDGYGDDAQPLEACTAPSGHVAVGGDCDDSVSSVNPGVAEVCDGLDQDCIDGADNGLLFQDWFPDGDGDGYGAEVAPISACLAPIGHVSVGGDCDDTFAGVSPGVPEVCDDEDQNCDLLPDNGLLFEDWYPDADADGYGDPMRAATLACSPVAGHVANDEDCNDDDPTVNPAAVEVCDGFDENCSGVVDDGLPANVFHRDYDRDGYGSALTVVTCMPAVDGLVLDGTDCNDFRPDVHPGAYDIGCNWLDEDCSGTDEPGDIDVPLDYPTLQDAVAAASPGDTICLGSGNWTGLTTATMDLNIVGTAGGAVLSNGNGNRVFVAAAGHQRLVNLTFDGRSVEPLIQVSSGAHLELVDVQAVDVGCNLFCNGLIAYQYPDSRLDVLNLSLVDYDGVIDTGNAQMNGLFETNGAELTLTDSSAYGLTVNTAGGTFLVSGWGNVELERVRLEAITVNSTDGFNLFGNMAGLSRGVLAYRNNVTADSGYAGLFDLAGTADIVQTTFRDNVVTSNGGDEAYLARTVGTTRLENVTFIGNSVATTNRATAVMGWGDVTLINSSFTENVGSGNPSAAAMMRGTGSIINTVFANDVMNSEIQAAPGITMDYTLVGGGPITPLLDLYSNQVPWYGLVGDPLFYPGVVYPMADSPLIDAGDPTILDKEGSRSDIGATGGPLGVGYDD